MPQDTENDSPLSLDDIGRLYNHIFLELCAGVDPQDRDRDRGSLPIVAAILTHTYVGQLAHAGAASRRETSLLRVAELCLPRK